MKQGNEQQECSYTRQVVCLVRNIAFPIRKILREGQESRGLKNLVVSPHKTQRAERPPELLFFSKGKALTRISWPLRPVILSFKTSISGRDSKAKEAAGSKGEANWLPRHRTNRFSHVFLGPLWHFSPKPTVDCRLRIHQPGGLPGAVFKGVPDSPSHEHRPIKINQLHHQSRCVVGDSLCAPLDSLDFFTGRR